MDVEIRNLLEGVEMDNGKNRRVWQLRTVFNVCTDRELDDVPEQ